MTIPTNGMTITEDTTLEAGVYYLPDGITIGADGVTLDGRGALLIGSNRMGRGVTVRGHSGVTLKNLRLREYFHGIWAEDASKLIIADCQITSTGEVAPNTIFLDIWLPAEQAYGSGILLHRVTEALIEHNDLQHQMCGLMTYGGHKLTVQGNVASYCSGWGFLLSDTQESRFEANYADFCSRWQPRGERVGHMGADAAGFLIVSGSSRNVFRGNYARSGGDGFFVAGLNPRYEYRPCNDNVFDENDVSYSPNIGFEATFCSGNIFRDNDARQCNYGFWLGFSADNILQRNRITACAQAGVAVENGCGMVVEDNNFYGSTHGILLWSKLIQPLIDVVPDNDTSHDWSIERNILQRHDKAIRIAADQDHGVRPFTPAGSKPPYNHVIRANTIEDNRIGIELVGAERTVIESNTTENNVEGDLRQ